MQVIKSFDVYPKYGDRYGFPKNFCPARHGNFFTWLINNGYPVNLITREAMMKISNTQYYDGLNGDLMEERIV